MKTLQFYKISVLALLILNITLMGFFFLNPKKPPHRQEHRFLNEAIEILQLNEKQAKKFEILAKEHSQDMEIIQVTQSELTTEYFELTKNKNKSDSLLNLIKKGEIQKIKITKSHFEDVKKILIKSQLPNYSEFEREALDRILLKKRPIISK